jgi:hypothetical protein
MSFNLHFLRHLAPHGAAAERAVGQPTDEERVRRAMTGIPQLSVVGPMHVVPLSGPGVGVELPPGLQIKGHVQPDTIAVVPVLKGETLCAIDVSDTVLFTAQGTTHEGDAVIAMLNHGARFSADEAIDAMRRVMKWMDVPHYTTMVLGGELSRDPAHPSPSVERAIALAQAAHEDGTLACGRIGVSQMGRGAVESLGLGARALPARADLPATPVCAVLTVKGLYYAEETEEGLTLFNRNQLTPVGFPLAGIATPPTH